MSMDDFVGLGASGAALEENVSGGATYPPSPDDRILPILPQDPVPNPEPEQPSLGVPDAGIYEGTGGTAALGDDVSLLLKR